MKTLAMILSPFIAMSAMANTTVMLTRTSNNGTVAPDYQTSSTCTVSDSNVQILHTGAAARFAHPLEKQAVYTADVPNDAVLASLANDAVRSPLVKTHIGPIGGAFQADSIHLDNSETTIAQKSGNVMIEQNTSASALKLEAFLNKNCN